MNTIKDRNSNAAFSIKEITTDYDRINSTINIVSNLIFQTNIYITNILDGINKKDSNYDITNDISTIRDLNIRSQDHLNTLHAITVGIINTYKNINSSITAETDGLESAFNSTGVITAILDSDLSKNNNSCNEISNIVSEMNHIVYDLNIYYIALEEMNDKIKDINKEVKLVVQYSDDVNDNMNQISEFIVQLGELVQKINNGLVYKK
jgi:methyl-accepting chemotaxis protein